MGTGAKSKREIHLRFMYTCTRRGKVILYLHSPDSACSALLATQTTNVATLQGGVYRRLPLGRPLPSISVCF